MYARRIRPLAADAENDQTQRLQYDLRPSRHPGENEATDSQSSCSLMLPAIHAS